MGWRAASSASPTCSRSACRRSSSRRITCMSSSRRCCSFSCIFRCSRSRRCCWKAGRRRVKEKRLLSTTERPAGGGGSGRKAQLDARLPPPGPPAATHLLHPPPLLLLLLDAPLALVQQVFDVGLGVAVLRRQLLLLLLQGLRVALVLLLQPKELPPQGGLPRDVHDGAAGREGGEGWLRGLQRRPQPTREGPRGSAPAPNPALIPGLAFLTTPVVLLLAATVLVFGLVCQRRHNICCLSAASPPPPPEKSQEPAGSPPHPPHTPFSPLFLRVRSMWSLSWMRTCRSVGWSRMKGNLRSCSVGGRLV